MICPWVRPWVQGLGVLGPGTNMLVHTSTCLPSCAWLKCTNPALCMRRVRTPSTRLISPAACPSPVTAAPTSGTPSSKDPCHTWPFFRLHIYQTWLSRGSRDACKSSGNRYWEKDGVLPTCNRWVIVSVNQEDTVEISKILDTKKETNPGQRKRPTNNATGNMHLPFFFFCPAAQEKKKSKRPGCANTFQPGGSMILSTPVAVLAPSLFVRPTDPHTHEPNMA